MAKADQSALEATIEKAFEERDKISADTGGSVRAAVEASLDLLDRGLGRWDERLAVRLLGGWRSRVWRQTTELLELDADRRRDRVGSIERQCARRARLLLT